MTSAGKALASIFRERSPGAALRAVAHRAPYELMNRAGLRRILEPSGHDAALKVLPRAQRISYDQWLERRPPFFLSDARSVGERISESGREGVLAAAEEATRGKIRAFGALGLEYGAPTEWFRDPLTGERWAQAHWSRCSSPGESDIKVVWEIGRFPQAFTFMRAFARDGGERWADAFYDSAREWTAANPFRTGVHWMNGQEMAIRVVSWYSALYAIRAVSASQRIGASAILDSIPLHCAQIERHIAYARYGMRNNHLIGEALALFLTGSLMPWLKSATRWERFGRELLEEESLAQFADDGVYIQNSHNYQRLAMDYLSVATLCGAAVGKPLSPEVRSCIAKSRALLHAQMNQDGWLPNWGENDGANLLPLTSASYPDFRPSLDLASIACGDEPSLSAPPDRAELSAWIVRAGAPPRSATRETVVPKTLRVLRRGPGDFATVRCAPWSGRLGHSDVNHCDVWLAGKNIACDTGSYFYNTRESVHQWLSSGPAHNTITVDGESHRARMGKWTWSGVIGGDAVGDEQSVTSTVRSTFHRKAGPLTHTRAVSPAVRGWQILDDASVDSAGEFALQWLLAFADWSREQPEQDTYRLTARIGDKRISLNIEVQGASADHALDIVPAVDGSAKGWMARHYGILTPGVSVTLRTRGTRLRVSSLFAEHD